MKTTRFVISLLSFGLLCCNACTKAPLNEVAGSYFYYDDPSLVFEDHGGMLKDTGGNISIACFNGPRVIGEGRECINILVPKEYYTFSGERLSFRHSFNAKIRFFTKLYEHGGHAVVNVHLQQTVKVHVSGAITNTYSDDFFQVGNVYPCSVSISFSLEDGTPVRLELKSMTVSDEATLGGGWLK